MLSNDTERRMAHIDRLERLANNDPLIPELLNRRAFDARLKKDMADGVHPISVVLSDIDHFKTVNDTYGHAAGDEALKAVARIILKHARRDVDYACRYGGEEFALAQPGGDVEAAKIIAEKIRVDIQNSVVTYNGQPVRFTISAGATERRPGESVHQIMARADELLYGAKRGTNGDNGRNQTLSGK